MLKQLNNMDWAALGVPMMPRWIEGIVSHDVDTREKSYDNLYDSGVIDLNKATPYVIPFLIDLLTEQDTPRKDAILQLLIVVASEALAYSDHPKLAEIANRTLTEINKGSDTFETYLNGADTKQLALELLKYARR